MSDSVTIDEPGLSCIQDLGRIGHTRDGLSVGGAMDQYSAQAAQVLTGNPRRAPSIEITGWDFSCRVSTTQVVAVTGAPADVFVDAHRRPQWQPVVVPGGSRLHVRGIRSGLRVYVAFHGGLEAPGFLGSVTPDLPIGFGSLLEAGQVIGLLADSPPVEHPLFGLPVFDLRVERPAFGDRWTIDVTEGPEAAQFPGLHGLLSSADYVVSGQSNDVGLRLLGAVPRRTVTTEMLSHGVPVGAVEAPTGDELLVLHRGRGVTAGYPIPAVVTAASLDLLGQARPGHSVRFRWVTASEAIATQRARRAALDDLEVRVGHVFAAHRIPVHEGPIS